MLHSKIIINIFIKLDIDIFGEALVIIETFFNKITVPKINLFFL